MSYSAAEFLHEDDKKKSEIVSLIRMNHKNGMSMTEIADELGFGADFVEEVLETIAGQSQMNNLEIAQRIIQMNNMRSE